VDLGQHVEIPKRVLVTLCKGALEKFSNRTCGEVLVVKKSTKEVSNADGNGFDAMIGCSFRELSVSRLVKKMVLECSADVFVTLDDGWSQVLIRLPNMELRVSS
jgi:hypothetical protein